MKNFELGSPEILLLLSWIAAFIIGIMVGLSFVDNDNDNDNRKPLMYGNQLDCYEKGGEYVLKVGSDGLVDYEWCEVNQTYSYE